MYTISKQFHFSAAHQLFHLPDDHPCSRLHGHNYIVEIVLQSEAVDERGFVMDYGDLKLVKDYIDTTFDHRFLNDVFKETSTSAENIAYWLFQIAAKWYGELVAVRVSETPKTWAEYRR